MFPSFARGHVYLPFAAGARGNFCHAADVLVIAKHSDVLALIGLDSLQGARAFCGDLVKNHRGHRDIYEINTKTSEGAPLRLFLKRNLNAYKKDGMLSFLRHGRCWSASREEWENSQRLQKAGLSTAGLVAWGEECGLLWEKFSFIITEAAPGIPLREFLRDSCDRARRRKVIETLGEQIARMHSAGLASPDLFTRHIFVSGEENVEFCLIDMARLDQRPHLPLGLRARDLAALHATAPLSWVSRSERMRFLRAYGGRIDQELAGRVERRAAHLLQRRKFQEFYVPA